MSFIETIHGHLATQPDLPIVQEVHGETLVPCRAADLAQLVARARGTLREHGVKPGDRVVLLASNSIRWVAADLALLFEGAVVVPMYARQDPAELVAMMHDCTPTLVVTGHQELIDAVQANWDEAPCVDFEALFQGAAVDEAPASRRDDDAVTIIYTSGSSGVPKGVVTTVGNVDFMLPVTRDALAKMMGPREGHDRVFHYLPFCFAGSRVVLWTCLFRANPILVSTDLDNLAVEFKTAAPHYFLNVPMLLERIKNGVESALKQRGAVIMALYRRGVTAYRRKAEGRARKRDRLILRVVKPLLFDKIHEQIGAQLECLICGSAPLGEDTQRWFEMVGIAVYQVYGLTETTAICTMDRPPKVKPGHVGPAIDGVEMRLSDDGELLIRGPNVFREYWGRPETTEAAFVDGWFRTGDLAMVDDEGYWTIVGRSKNLLVPTSGHNIAPEPIEQSLVENTEGADAVVLVGHGRPFVAAIFSGAVALSDAEASIARVNEDLPHYRRVRKYFVAPEPFTVENGLLTANRKLRRSVIEKHYATRIDELYA